MLTQTRFYWSTWITSPKARYHLNTMKPIELTFDAPGIDTKNRHMQSLVDFGWACNAELQPWHGGLRLKPSDLKSTDLKTFWEPRSQRLESMIPMHPRSECWSKPMQWIALRSHGITSDSTLMTRSSKTAVFVSQGGTRQNGSKTAIPEPLQESSVWSPEAHRVLTTPQ